MKKKGVVFNKKYIDGLELPKKKPVFVWDAGMKHFGIKLNPTGKVFVIQTRVNGRTRRVKVGDYGDLTLKQAHDKAQTMLAEMATGKDIVQERKISQAQGITLDAVKAAYIKDRKLKPSSIRDINKHMNNTLEPWKNKPVVEITRDMVLEKFREKSEGSPAQANQCFRILRAMLNYAMETYRPGDKSLLLENPVNVLSGARIWNQIKPKKRRIPLESVGTAWCLLEKIQQDPFVSPEKRSLVDAVMFCLLTGARWGEVQKLKWSNVDLERGTWHIEDPKNSNDVTLPLSTQAQMIIGERIRANDFVFCSGKSKTGHVGPGRMITDKLATAFEIELSPHDLRRTFRSVAAELNIELWRTKLLMNHRINNDVTIQSYTEKHDLEYLRPSIQAIGTWIETKANEFRAKVVDIKTKRAG